MLYPFQVVSVEPVSLPPLPDERPPAARFMELAAGLSALFDESPAILRLPDSPILTLLYRDVAYRWQDILDSVGPPAAELSTAAPLRFFGTTEARETAEITLNTSESGRTLVQLRSVSGRPFDLLQGLGVQMELPTGAEAAQMAQVLAVLPRSGACGVLPRCCEEYLASCRLLIPTAGSFFSYLAWEGAGPRRAICALGFSHKAELWRVFLLDAQQPAEFDWLWDNYYTGEPLFLLEWELALRTVLDDLGFQIERGPAHFQVLDRDGRERRFDFTNGGPAEKLFLKLLFPLDTK